MTKEEIIENNELIARFDNKQFPSGCISDFPEGKLPEKINKKYLLYHKSWNQLMPVVERIDCLGYTTLIRNYGDEYSNFVEILNTDEDPLQICCFTEHVKIKSKLELTYKAVVKFIKYYNEINNKK